MATPPLADCYIAVRCDGVSRYAPLAEFLGAMTTLDAAFASADTPAGPLVHGPSHAQYDPVFSSVTDNGTGIADAIRELDAIEARIAAIENQTGLAQFDDEFSQDFR